MAKCNAASTSLAEHVVPVIDADAPHRTCASLTALERKPTLLDFVPGVNGFGSSQGSGVGTPLGF